MALTHQKKEMLFSQLHSLLTAGLDFSRSFELLIESEKEVRIRELLESIYAGIVRGDTLWLALKESREFSALDYGVIRIGEETGKLAQTLDFLTDYYHKYIEQKRMITSSLSYPLIILVTAGLVVVFMVLVVVPMFEQVYTRMGSELPALTKGIIAFSKVFPLYAAGGLATGLFVGTWLYLKREQEQTQKNISRVLLKIPIVSSILKHNHQCNFCKLLYLLTSSGVPLLQGVQLLEQIISFYPYRVSFRQICTLLEQGELFSQGLEQYPHLYNKKLTTLLKVGEESNKLPFMLKKQGDELAVELEYKLKYLGTLLEPVLILFIGVMVAIILISMYLPMFKLGGVIQ